MSFPVSQALRKLSTKIVMSYVRGRVMVAFPISELYFLIAKFLSGGPLKETAKVNWLRIHSIIIYLEFRSVTEMFYVTDFAERARKC